MMVKILNYCTVTKKLKQDFLTNQGKGRNYEEELCFLKSCLRICSGYLTEDNKNSIKNFSNH